MSESLPNVSVGTAYVDVLDGTGLANASVVLQNKGDGPANVIFSAAQPAADAAAGRELMPRDTLYVSDEEKIWVASQPGTLIHVGPLS